VVTAPANARLPLWGVGLGAIQTMGGCMWQRRWLHQLQWLCRQQNTEHPCITSAVATVLGKNMHPYTCGGLCLVLVKKWGVLLLLSLPESYDIINDAVVAGGVKHTLHPAAEASFKTEWQRYPYGTGLASMGMAGAIRTSFAFAIFSQAVVALIAWVDLVRVIKKNRTFGTRPRRCKHYGQPCARG